MLTYRSCASRGCAPLPLGGAIDSPDYMSSTNDENERR